MSFGEFFNAFGSLGDAYREGADRADLKKYQQDAVDLYGKQLDGILAAQVQPQPQPGGLSALGAPPQPSKLPSFAASGGGMGDYLSVLRGKESAGNASARNPNSSATGLDQFTAGTWAGLSRKYPQLGLTPDGRTDPEQSTRAMEAFTRDNATALSRAGVPITPGNLYVSHFLGEAGGPRFVAGAMSNPDAPAVNFVDPGAARANRTIFFNRDGSPKTAGEVYAERTSRFGGVPTPPMRSADAGAAPASPTPGPMQMPGVIANAPLPPQRPVQLASADPDGLQLPTGVSGLNPGMPPQMAARAPVQAPPALAPSGARSMVMPGQPAPAPVAAPQQQAGGDDQADIPAPNAQPAGFQIPGQAPQPVPSDFVPGSVASPAIGSPQQGQLPAVSGAPRLSPQRADFLRAQLANPLTRAQAIQTIQSLGAPEKWETKEIGGRVVQTNSRGDVRALPGFDKPTTYQTVTGPDGNAYTFNPQTGGWTRAIEGKEKAFTDVTDPQERRAANVPDWYTGTVQRGPDRRIYYPGAGQQGVTPQQKILSKQESDLADDDTKQVLEARNAAQHAGQKLQTLSIVGDAWKRGGDNISTGPGAEAVLKAKQIAANFGIPVQGVADSEIVQKVGTQLAAQTAKDLTSRPTQFDFAVMLQNNPGLLISKEGNLALINIGQQQAKRELQLSALARKWKPGQSWGDQVEEFEKSHPIVSPLTGKPIDPNELIAPQFGAQAAGGGPGGQPGAQALKPMGGDLMGEARAAIAAGKPAAAVIQRLRERGFDPGGL